MKKVMLNSFLLAGILYLSACNNDTKTADETTTDSSTQTEQTTTTTTPESTMTPKSSMADDSAFALKAADGGMMEVTLGQLALKNATSAAVKKHAQMMITDHSKANTELKALAASKNIVLPIALSAEKQQKVDEFKAKKGSTFDKDYTDFMVEDHKKDIDNFKKEAESGSDSEIKTWAAGKVPTLEQHLQMWESTKEGGTGAKKDTAHAGH